MATKSKTIIGPRELKDPRSYEYAKQTVSHLKRLVDSERADRERIERELALIRQYKHWEILGYTSEDELLKSEIGLDAAGIVELANRVEEMPPLPTKGQIGNGRSSERTPTKVRGETAEYLTRRIARDNPEVLERMKAGEFKSVRQAAIAAGIVKPPTPKDQLAKAVKKVNADGGVYVSLRAVFDAMDDQQRKTAMTMWSDWLGT